MSRVKRRIVQLIVIATAVIAIVSVASANAILIQTDQSQSFLNQSNIVLMTPTTKPIKSEEEAIKAASSYCNVIAQTATSVHVEYQLMTSSNESFSESAKAKNAQLYRDGHLNNTPVYIVTFKGVNFRGGSGGTLGVKTQPIIFHENNVVVDANSGEILFSYSYK